MSRESHLDLFQDDISFISQLTTCMYKLLINVNLSGCESEVYLAPLSSDLKALFPVLVLVCQDKITLEDWWAGVLFVSFAPLGGTLESSQRLHRSQFLPLAV